MVPKFAEPNCLLPVVTACHMLLYSNTLELPDYAEALIATQPELKQEWSNAIAAGAVAASSRHAGGSLGSSACPKLWQACCKLLDERLQVGDCKIRCWTVLTLSRTRQHTGCMSHTTCICVCVSCAENATAHPDGGGGEGDVCHARAAGCPATADCHLSCADSQVAVTCTSYGLDGT